MYGKAGLKSMEQATLNTPCHCTGKTVAYRKRVLREGKTIKTYHRCENCASRFVDIWVQEIDNARSVSIFDLNTKDFEQSDFSAPDCF